MTTYDLDRMLDEWMDAAEPMSEPPALLPSVFTVTRSLPQRHGLTGRVAVALRSGPALFQFDTRPVLTYAILILLLLSMTFAVAFASGLLRPRIPTGWRALEGGLPIGSQVTDIERTSSGFAAVGDSTVSDETCDRTTGQVWTSPDGDVWTPRSVDSLVGIRPQKLVVSGEWIYLVGAESPCEDPDEHIPSGGGLWRSRDGVTWEELPRSETVFQYGNEPFMVDLDGTLIAINHYQVVPDSLVPVPGDDGEFADGDWELPEMRVWSSTDGAAWEHLSTLESFDIYGLASNSGVLVALAGHPGQPGIVTVRSADGGRTWEEQELPSGIPQSSAFLVAGSGRFVAAGDEVAVASTDGKTWTVAESDPALLDGVTGLWAMPDGFLVVRDGREDGLEAKYCTATGGIALPVPSMDKSESPPAEIYVVEPDPVGPTETCVPTVGAGGTAVSADGISWERRSDLPMSIVGDPDTAYGLATDEHSIVVTDWSRGAAVWYSPLEAFRAD